VIVFSMLSRSGAAATSAGESSGDDDKLRRVLAAVRRPDRSWHSSPVAHAHCGGLGRWERRSCSPWSRFFRPRFLMGMAVSQRPAAPEELHPPSVRWAWSLNAAASVAGPAGAIFLPL